MLDLLERRGTRLDEFHGIGSAAYLYDLGPEGAGGFSHESIGQGYGRAANASRSDREFCVPGIGNRRAAQRVRQECHGEGRACETG
jgi:hypothetical protein